MDSDLSKQLLLPCIWLVVVFFAVSGPARGQDDLQENLCVMCHGEKDIWETDTLHLYVGPEHLSDDIHWQKGLRCHDCHGGNPQSFELREAHALENGFRKIATPADVPSFCGHCHSDADYMSKSAPDANVEIVAQFWRSAHGQDLKQAADPTTAANCTSCHAKHSTRAVDDPASAVHPSRLVETCGSCHQTQRDELLVGMHRVAGAKDDAGTATALSCTKCHGSDVHGMRPVQDEDSPVFVHHQVQNCGECHEKSLDTYLDSVHGHGLQRSGLVATAVCSSCHNAHAVFPPPDKRSMLHATKVAGTCGKCHMFIEDRLALSIHGRGRGFGELADRVAPGGTKKRKPSCTDCHRGHNLPDPGSAAFRIQQPNLCGNCHDDLSVRYAMSLHGQLTDLGNTEAAKCSDCHGSHDILPIDDPKSRMSVANRVDTCRKCHEDAAANLVSFDPHADHKDPKRSALLYYAHRGMELLLLSVFCFFGVHTGLWFIRSWIHRVKHNIPRRLAQGRRAYTRFEPIHRYLHVIVIVSFLGLALTGLPLKYSQQPWAKWLADAMGGFQTTSVLHRFCAVLTGFYCVTHLIWLLRRIGKGRAEEKSWKTILVGPDSMIINLRDLKDFGRMLRWFIGLGPRPTFERWTYWEKFDYWAVFWGVTIIGSTGLMLWFPDVVCTVLPGRALNIAKVIHSEEALLATGFIFTIHFFNTHLRAEKFPMDMGMLAGMVTEEELQHERPDFVARMREEGRLDALRTTAPSNSKLWWIRLGGALALALGIALLLGILLALLS